MQLFLMRAFTPFVGDEEIRHIAEGLIECTLPKSAWTHAAHFAAALWLLRRSPDLDVPTAMPNLIRRYNTATGVVNSDSSGYHETITLASIRAARAFHAEHSAHPLYSLCNSLMASSFGNPDWLTQYWSRERLFSVDARRSWVNPDLMVLPF